MRGRSRKRVFVLERARIVPGTRAVPLVGLYVLTRPPRAGAGGPVRVRRLSPREAFARIVANTFNPVVDERARLGRLLQRAAWLAPRVPVRALTFPRELATLPAVLRMVLADAARLAAHQARGVAAAAPAALRPAPGGRLRLRRPRPAR